MHIKTSNYIYITQIGIPSDSDPFYLNHPDLVQNSGFSIVVLQQQQAIQACGGNVYSKAFSKD